MPGFSTAEQISDVSGRGVGMDVVRRNINDLGGHVQISSKEGLGSTIRIRLPLTLAILDGQLVRVGKEIYIISLLAIVETIQVPRERVNNLAGRTEVFRLREEYLPVVKLCDQFGVEPDSRSAEDGLLVVVEADGKRAGVLVDDLARAAAGGHQEPGVEFQVGVRSRRRDHLGRRHGGADHRCAGPDPLGGQSERRRNFGARGVAKISRVRKVIEVWSI